METKTDNLTITLEDFKLIKSFHTEFIRKPGIETNDFVISWNELMPVVEKIENLGFSTAIKCNGINTTVTIDHISEWENPSLKIQKVYRAVVKWIKWYNTQPK